MKRFIMVRDGGCEGHAVREYDTLDEADMASRDDPYGAFVCIAEVIVPKPNGEERKR